MKKSIIKTVVLAALMALPMFAKAQTFAGITAEQNAQNTPEGWTAVELPQLPTITSANTFNIKDYGASTSAADNTKAIQKALDAVPSTGGMVVIPAGTWMFGSTDQMTSKTEVLSIKCFLDSLGVVFCRSGSTIILDVERVFRSDGWQLWQFYGSPSFWSVLCNLLCCDTSESLCFSEHWQSHERSKHDCLND